VRVWGESIRYVLKKDAIGVSVVCPGFVVSRMTAQGPIRLAGLVGFDKMVAQFKITWRKEHGDRSRTNSPGFCAAEPG